MMFRTKLPKRLSRYQLSLISLVSALLLALAVPSTIDDVFFPGSQDGESGTFEPPTKCDNCHSYDKAIEPSFNWSGGMMAQAQRDPLYLACLAISNQDVPDVGDLCIRCHTPEGWLGGRSIPTDASGLLSSDMDGVHCDICHKMVKPTAIGTNPYPEDTFYTDNTYSIDQAYLQTLAALPPTSGNGMYIVSSGNEKRGPFTDAGAKHSFLYSPFQKESALCGTCHDVSNPVYVRNPDDTYSANDFGEPSPTFNTYELFPVERTYSEWLMSAYNSESGVYAPQMGGNKDYVSTCQDCHMRDLSGVAANKTSAVYRDDLPHHDLTGGNTFVPELIKQTHAGSVDEEALDSGIVRAKYMLKNAATFDLSVVTNGDSFLANVRVTNETGHKLPSGYPEGRRIWINIIARDINNQVIYESGNYNLATGVLTKDIDAKIYEIKPGLDSTIASITGFPQGPSFHFALNNIIYSDNRIPPRGFTNSAFETIQSPPIAYSYADGQYWDDTEYTIPLSTVNVEAILYYQTVSKEYVEFLRDENVTNDAGQVMYNLWNSNGKSAPIVMNSASVIVETDSDGDGVPDVNDNCPDNANPSQTDLDGDGYGAACDCDDTDNTITTGSTWYADSDGDGFGDPDVSTTACSAPPGYVANNTDCDDTDNTITTGSTWYADSDGDGFGDPDVSTTACSAPPKYVANNTDCDDTDNTITTGPTWYADSDGDGFGDPEVSTTACTAPPGYVANNTDCDDTDNTITSGSTWYADSDGDGFGDPDVSTTACSAPPGYVANNTDCDDTDNTITSGSTWYADSDGDGFGDPDVSTTACSAPPGYVANNTDCEDTDSGVYPDAPALPDGKDNNCDGTIDKLSQTITYSEIPDILETELNVTLNAESSSGLPVYFQIIEGNVVLNENLLSIEGPGKVRIKIQQDGSEGYDPAETIILEFCILPVKPSIAKSQDGDKYILTSNSAVGNQWYLDEKLISGQSDPSIFAEESGSYTLQVNYGECVSELSDPLDIEITGILDNEEFKFILYPNPAADVISIRLPSMMQNSELYLNVVDTYGRYLQRSQPVELLNGDISLDISQFKDGTYSCIIEDRESGQLFRGQFIIHR